MNNGVKNVIHCLNCGEVGHNRRSCKKESKVDANNLSNYELYKKTYTAYFQSSVCKEARKRHDKAHNERRREVYGLMTIGVC